MRHFARIICPVVAAIIVVSILLAIRNYDPEPRTFSPAGAALLVSILVASQVPLALAPWIARRAGWWRILAAAGMIPSALLVQMIVFDLLPRILFPGETSTNTVAVVVLSVFGYLLGCLSLRTCPAA